MTKVEQKKELTDHWKSHSDEASSHYNNATTSQRATLAVVFGATALGLTAIRALPQSEVAFNAGASLVALNFGLGIYANHHFSNYKKFYKAAKNFAEQRHVGLLKGEAIDANFTTFEGFDKEVEIKTKLKRPNEKREYYISQSSIVGLAIAATVAWYFSTSEPEDVTNVRLEDTSNVELSIREQNLAIPKVI